MKAIAVTCPHCGARLKAGDTQVQVVCEYCGTAARLQRRTRVLERVIPPPEAPNLPRQIAVQRRTYALPIIGSLIGIAIPTVLVPIMAHRAQQSISTPGGLLNRAVSDDGPGWQGTESALLVDIDRDGTQEIIGRSRRVRNSDVVAIVALDVNGKLRWESEPLGTYEATYQGPLAHENDLLFFATARGEVRAFNITNGKQQWTAQLPERTKMFCAAGDALIAVGADDVQRALRRADGTSTTVPLVRGSAASPATPKPKGRNKPRCTPLPTDREDTGDWFQTRQLADKHGVSGSTHKLVDSPAGVVIAGTRSKGTAVPVLVALDRANKVRWRVDVPLDPLGSETSAPTAVVAGADAVCAAYHAESITKPLDLTCFALADGRRMWNKKIESHHASALVIMGDLLLVSWSGVLEARAVATGDVRWRFGR